MECGASGDDTEYTLVNIANGLTVARHIRIAHDSLSRRKGLLGITDLGRDSGLWIVPCEAIHTFGMKIPIDVLFLDREFQVKKLRRSMPPYRISICLPASSVVELRQGAITASDIKVGDRLSVQRTSKEDEFAGEGMKLDSRCPSS